jgi:hypothetical protein
MTIHRFKSPVVCQVCLICKLLPTSHYSALAAKSINKQQKNINMLQYCPFVVVATLALCMWTTLLTTVHAGQTTSRLASYGLPAVAPNDMHAVPSVTPMNDEHDDGTGTLRYVTQDTLQIRLFDHT